MIVMPGINNLKVLLKSMKPKLVKGKYVFCRISANKFSKLNDVEPVMCFSEKEGITLILEKKDADKLELNYETIWAFITLTVHSDLNAIGFLAEITKVLAKNKISVNAVSAYYHDHLFVPYAKANKVIKLLTDYKLFAK